MRCAELLSRHKVEWHLSTEHRFLKEACAGTLERAVFLTWMTQDYLFVLEFARMCGRAIGVARVDHMDALMSGVSALREELQWFGQQAKKFGVTLSDRRHPTCEAYCDYIASLAKESYTVQAVAIWAIEYTFNFAWRQAMPMPEPYQEFALRWGSDDFSTYVQVLETQANEALADGLGAQVEKASEVLLQICAHEKAFWDMAYYQSPLVQ